MQNQRASNSTSGYATGSSSGHGYAHGFKPSGWLQNGERVQLRHLPDSKYRCSYCPKIFRTLQAVGGHQNAHKRERQDLRREYKEDRKTGQKSSTGLGIGGLRLKPSTGLGLGGLRLKSSTSLGVGLGGLRLSVGHDETMRSLRHDGSSNEVDPLLTIGHGDKGPKNGDRNDNPATEVGNWLTLEPKHYQKYTKLGDGLALGVGHAGLMSRFNHDVPYTELTLGLPTRYGDDELMLGPGSMLGCTSGPIIPYVAPTYDYSWTSSNWMERRSNPRHYQNLLGRLDPWPGEVGDGGSGSGNDDGSSEITLTLLNSKGSDGYDKGNEGYSEDLDLTLML